MLNECVRSSGDRDVLNDLNLFAVRSGVKYVQAFKSIGVGKKAGQGM